jgi:hypothetical protein
MVSMCPFLSLLSTSSLKHVQLWASQFLKDSRPSTTTKLTTLTIFFHIRVVTTSKLTIFFHPRVVTTSKLTNFFHPRVVTTSKLTIFFHPRVVTTSKLTIFFSSSDCDNL